MTATSFLLILLSAIAHAGWNFLLKRANDHEAFVWWMQLGISVIFCPLAIALCILTPIKYPEGWIFVLGTSVLHAFYFVLLGRGYAHGDLSTVYPVARGTGPALVPILGVFILGEAISSQAIIGIVAVVVGIFVVYWSGNLTKILKNPLMFLSEKSTMYALATGIFICLYSVWDKKGVDYVSPFLYMYLMALGSGIFITPYILKARSMGALIDEWRLNYRAIVIVSVLTFIAYGLVLSALTLSKLSYVWPAREMGIVIAVLLGALVLKEPFGRPRLLGSLLVVIGVALVALAP